MEQPKVTNSPLTEKPFEKLGQKDVPPAIVVEQIGVIEKLTKQLLSASHHRVEQLALKNQWVVNDKKGAQHTLNYRPLSIREWRDIENRAADIMLLEQKFKDELMTHKNEPELFSGIVARGKKEITAKVVETFAITADYYFGIKYTGSEDDPFYDYDYRQMVELVMACKLRTENGDPNA